MIPAVGLVSLLWVISSLIPQSEANIPIAKTQCCDCKLEPINKPDGTEYQYMPSPFRIEVSKDVYNKGDVHVNLVAYGGESFTQFMLGAYKYGYLFADDKNPKGSLELLPGQDAYKIRKKICGPNSDKNFAVVSDDQAPKQILKFIWRPNPDTKGHIEFRATFIKNDKTFWVSEKSKAVQDPREKPIATRYSHIAPIDTSDCGGSKGCFLEPENCRENECQYVFTWKNRGSKIDFELGGLTDNVNDRYVAVGFSDDKYMGDDHVFTCAHSSVRDTTEVYESINKVDPKRNIPIKKYDKVDSASREPEYAKFESEEGSHINYRLRCRFTVKLNAETEFLNKRKHLLFSYGYATNGAPNNPWLVYEDPPGASADEVDLTSDRKYTGWATYPLVKAHAILMILAWVLCNSIGMLLSKYYTKMWPNRTVYDQKYWFLGHSSLVTTAFIICIISIIIIFAETGGYSEAPDLALKAHPILGIIILVCILIIPIIAILRPSDPGNCQNIFNWLYWLFCTIANVLAIPNIFIGMDFGKAGIPWWATWILVIWVIFHIAVEITLEVHQCCTHKKNKERRKKYELAKKENPKQVLPEPQLSGKRFKRFMLTLHVGITILITLIMVIIIAVA